MNGFKSNIEEFVIYKRAATNFYGKKNFIAKMVHEKSMVNWSTMYISA